MIKALDEIRRLLEVLSIAERRRDRVKIAFVWLWLVMRGRLGIKAGRAFRIRWGEDGALAALVGDPSELQVLREMFFVEEYEVPDDVRPEVIVDLGSNVGLSVLYFKTRFPAARIVAVEPDPATAERLRHNLAEVPGVTIVEAAAAVQDGEVTLYSGPKSWSSSTWKSEDRPVEHMVPGTSLEALAEQLDLRHIDVLKVDIEGGEADLLACSPLARDADVIVFEFHQEHADLSVWDLIAKLPDHDVVRTRDDSAKQPVVTLRRRNETRRG